MHSLREIFPKYGADGLEAIDNELENGNTKSRLAAIWLLNGFARSPYAMPPLLVEHIEKAVLAIHAVDEPYKTHAVDLAKKTAVTLRLKQGLAIAGQEWLEDYVRKIVASAQSARAENYNGSFGGISHPWVLDEDLWVAAVEIEAAGRMKLNWKLVAEALVHERYRRVSNRTDEVFDALANHDRQAFNEATATRLQQLAVQPGGGGGGGFGGGRGSGGMGMSRGPRDSFWSGISWTPVFDLATEDSVWPKVLTLYAQHTSDAEGSLAALENLRKEMVDSGADPKHADKPFQWIDAAIEMLKNTSPSQVLR
jgi:hypothetical protein